MSKKLKDKISGIDKRLIEAMYIVDLIQDYNEFIRAEDLLSGSKQEKINQFFSDIRLRKLSTSDAELFRKQTEIAERWIHWPAPKRLSLFKLRPHLKAFFEGMIENWIPKEEDRKKLEIEMKKE